MVFDATQQVRFESDSMGEIAVPADRLWGPQTQRALRYFNIGTDLMPAEIVRAVAMIKKAAAITNRELGMLESNKADLIIAAAEEIIAGRLQEHFPLSVWMSGSGTQLNMNVNEVIANRGIERAGGSIGSKNPLHPNDHVNLSQSTNDLFPTAMHLAAALAIRDRLLPSLRTLQQELDQKAVHWAAIVKIGRTHLQDALPMTLGQEFAGYAGMLDDNRMRLEAVLLQLNRVAMGGTAVGTGFGASPGFAEGVCGKLSTMTGLALYPAANRFAVMGAHDDMIMTSAVLKTLACSLYKIANDIRLLGSGPRCGLHELKVPAHEPGSSMMPGKSNPTQCEALSMLAVQVMGYDAAVAFSGAGGHLEMNAYKPLIIYNVLKSIALLADGCDNFAAHLVKGLEPDHDMMHHYLYRSLMLVTGLVPAIGYDKAAEIASLAHDLGITLQEACAKRGYVTADEFDRLTDPGHMAQPTESRNK
jgi:fumarate hydratase class II